jgi:hypothetical protein
LASRAELADQVSVLQNIAGRTEPESLLQIPGCSARKKKRFLFSRTGTSRNFITVCSDDLLESWDVYGGVLRMLLGDVDDERRRLGSEMRGVESCEALVVL